MMTAVPDNPALLIDLYELTMAASYYEHKRFGQAAFSLFIRNYPNHRSYFVSAGLANAVEFLSNFQFTSNDLEYLNTTGLFQDDFLHYLHSLRFTGNVLAIPEGRLFFRNEPILEVTAPIIQAQLVETFLINAINLQVTIASKAARCVYASRGRRVVDFSLRRAQGTDAALKAARASYIAGFSGTSNVLAGKLYGIPSSGTMAHSYIESFRSEIDAFRAYAQTFPDNTIFLIDTYDTIKGAGKALKVAKEMLTTGHKLKGLRLDSGNIAELSKTVRRLATREGLGDIIIIASGGLDEYEIARIIENGGEIDVFAVGTKVGVAADSPYTDMAYKLVSYDGHPVLKLSKHKQTLAGKKQVFRMKSGGKLTGDIIGLGDEILDGELLLKPVIEGGNKVANPVSLATIRNIFHDEFAALDERYKTLKKYAVFPVRISEKLADLQQRTRLEVRRREGGKHDLSPVLPSDTLKGEDTHGCNQFA